MSLKILSFYKAFLKSPRSVGAIFPSSKLLANTIARFVPLNSKMIVELGAGTGVVTQALLDHGINSQQILAIEAFEDLAKQLKQRFPHVNVLHGDAANLVKLLSTQKIPVSAVVSSLPLLSLTPEVTATILHQVDQILEPGGRYIQYTYGKKDQWVGELHNYQKIAKKFVWFNLPPARVFVYIKPK